VKGSSRERTQQENNKQDKAGKIQREERRQKKDTGKGKRNKHKFATYVCKPLFGVL